MNESNKTKIEATGASLFVAFIEATSGEERNRIAANIQSFANEFQEFQGLISRPAGKTPKGTPKSGKGWNPVTVKRPEYLDVLE